MTLLFMDGFDVQDAATKWTSHNWNLCTYQTGRLGTGSCAQWNQYSSLELISKSIPAAATVIFGAAVNLEGMGGSNIWSLYGDSGVTDHLDIGFTLAGAMTLSRGGTQIAISADSLVNVGTWQYIEFKATIASSGGIFIAHCNGVEIINFTGNTKNGGTNSTIDRVAIRQPNGNYENWQMDDVYICNGLGSTNNDFLGDVRVQALLPTGAGTTTQLTPSTGSNWSNVDDAPPVTTTYNSSSTSTNRDTYAMGDLPSGTGTVFATQDVIYASKSDAGSASIKAAVRSGGTVYYDATVVLSTSPQCYMAVRETDPATSAAWTAANVNALEFGAEVV